VEIVMNLFDDKESIIIYDIFQEYAAFRKKTKQEHMLYTPSYFRRGNYSTGEMYFENLSFSDDEVYVDCGSNHGSIIDKFISVVGKYKSIYGYEPQIDLYEKLKQTYKENHKIHIDNHVVGAECGYAELSFSPGSGDYMDFRQSNVSFINSTKKTEYVVSTLDILLKAVCNTSPPTFIKMDIEGKEKEALIGATRVLKEHKPKLAIACYHKIEDFKVLPNLIKTIQPDYQLYLRYYKEESPCSLILYAV
jgi:FkbM family methyltransferase